MLVLLIAALISVFRSWSTSSGDFRHWDMSHNHVVKDPTVSTTVDLCCHIWQDEHTGVCQWNTLGVVLLEEHAEHSPEARCPASAHNACCPAGWDLVEEMHLLDGVKHWAK